MKVSLSLDALSQLPSTSKYGPSAGASGDNFIQKDAQSDPYDVSEQLAETPSANGSPRRELGLRPWGWGGEVCLLQKLKYVPFGGESVRRGALAAFVGQSAAGGSWFCCQGLRPLNIVEPTRDQRRILSKVYVTSKVVTVAPSHRGLGCRRGKSRSRRTNLSGSCMFGDSFLLCAVLLLSTRKSGDLSLCW